jgi:NAD(P)-dependent dehydrogenase (short-subunit alcohol dehydrogenase family)
MVTSTDAAGLDRDTLAVELARYRFRCNIVTPGWTRTAMIEDLYNDERFRTVSTGSPPAASPLAG